LTKYRFAFIVETEEDPDIIFRKIWDALKEFDEDHFGMYQIMHSHKDMIRILSYVYTLNDWDKLTQEVLTEEINEHIKEYVKEKKK